MDCCDKENMEERLKNIEDELKAINATLNQVAGVWFFLKLVGSIGLGAAVLYNGLHSFFSK